MNAGMETAATTTTAAAPPPPFAAPAPPAQQEPTPTLEPEQPQQPPADVVACQVPPRRFTPDGKVTSVDLTPDGAYVVAGCSDGTIRLYSMHDSGWGCEGAILGQIHAKGLITNLIFHVEVRKDKDALLASVLHLSTANPNPNTHTRPQVTDDGRFAFAGVLRGSVEMFAYDLTRLPRGEWAADGTPIPPPKRLSRAQAEALIDCHANLDPKLRGFGAAARLTGAADDGASSPFPEYRLVCGLGIKNLHIWRFQERVQQEEEPVWECIYDLVSSGMSIELLALRPGKRVLPAADDCTHAMPALTTSALPPPPFVTLPDSLPTTPYVQRQAGWRPSPRPAAKT